MTLRTLFARGAMLAAAAALLSGCPSTTGTKTNVTSGQGGPSIAEARAEPYNGPKARLAVARFENKSADARRFWNPQLGDGMADMLTTALVNSGRFIVVERGAGIEDVLQEQDFGASGRVRQDTAAATGEIEGAELLVVAAVTEFEGNAGGTRGGAGGIGGGVLGAVFGGSRQAHMAIDLRIVDATTSRILSATSVEGEASDFNIGGALAGYTGSVGLGGGLQSWENTPREKALRQVIGKAVEVVINKTPQNYYRHGQGRNTGASTTATAAGSGSGASGGTGERVVITADSLNVRSGPGASNPVQFGLSQGTIVDVVARQGDWVQVRDNSGRSGWVAAAYTVSVE